MSLHNSKVNITSLNIILLNYYYLNFYLIYLLLVKRGFSCVLHCTLCVRVCMIESGSGLQSVRVGALYGTEVPVTCG